MKFIRYDKCSSLDKFEFMFISYFIGNSRYINTIVNYDWNNTETFLIFWHGIRAKPINFISIYLLISFCIFKQWLEQNQA